MSGKRAGERRLVRESGETATVGSEPSARLTVYVHLDHGRSFAAWTERYRQGEVWEQSPYSYALASDRTVFSGSEDAGERSVSRLVRRGVTYALGFDIVHAWRNRARWRGADVVWTHSEHEHLAVRAVEVITRRPHVPMIAQSIWLWDAWSSLPRWKRWMYMRLLQRGRSVHTTLSRVNARVAERVLSEPVYTVPFGAADVQVARPLTNVSGEITLLAPGNDRHRDWVTLFAAVEGQSQMALTVLTRRLKPSRGFNFTIRRALSIADTADEYAKSSVVVVPLRKNLHASGITVAMEALSAGCALVIADAGGVRDYFGQYAQYYRVGDPDSLRLAIYEAARARTITGSDVKRRHGLTARDYVDRHLAISEWVTGVQFERPDFDVFAPFTWGHRDAD